MGRLLIYNPEIRKDTILHFNFTKSGSWKLRDFSSGVEKIIGSNQTSKLSVDEILESVEWQDQADSSVSVKNHKYWKNVIAEQNKNLREMMENYFNEKESSDPFDSAINKYLNELIDKAKRLQPISRSKIDPVNIINDAFKIERISTVDQTAALDPANTVLKNIAADLCERNEILQSNDFYENLKLLQRYEILSEKTLDYYHFIRKLRNKAVHPKIKNKPDIDLNDTRVVRLMLANILDSYLESIA